MGNVVCSGRLNNQVKMVGHEARGEDRQIYLLLCTLHEGYER
jgi:hypothetical protein